MRLALGIVQGRVVGTIGEKQYAQPLIGPFTNLRAKVELKEGTQFIHIKNLEGIIADRSAKIYNTSSAVTAGDSLQPWYFEEFGLNFGILTLETDERGIPLSIPGLMNPGDIGFFATIAKSETRKFYFLNSLSLIDSGIFVKYCVILPILPEFFHVFRNFVRSGAIFREIIANILGFPYHIFSRKCSR